MKKITFNVRDAQVPFFMDLINKFDFVKIEDKKDSKKKILQKFKKAVNDLKLIQQGELNKTLAREFLNDL